MVTMGDLPISLFGADRRPLDPQIKAQMLAEMPFVSEPVGDDISDLGDATPTGKGRAQRRMILGGALGLAVAYAASRFIAGFKAAKKRGQ